MSTAFDFYEKALQKYLDNQSVYFFWKARVGLYGILKSMGVGPGDEVILPAYTCVVVPNAIIYLGAKPIYVDIDIDNFNSDIALVNKALSDKTKVIICQNTYGLSTNLEAVIELATAQKIYTIEDCTHGFGGLYNDKKNGLRCDAAIFSSQWNKPFSTGIGGFAICRDSEVESQLQKYWNDLEEPNLKEVLQLRVLLFVRRYILNEFTYWPLLRLYRFLSSKNLVVGSSSNTEVVSTKLPKGFFKKLSKSQAIEGVRALKNFDSDLSIRKKNASAYTRLLIEMKKNHVDNSLNDNHSFLKYPLLVSEREQFFKMAELSKIELGDWFTSPLHPVSDGLDGWGFLVSDYPNAVFCAKHVVNIPTTPKRLERVLQFLKENEDLILDSNCLPRKLS